VKPVSKRPKRRLRPQLLQQLLPQKIPLENKSLLAANIQACLRLRLRRPKLRKRRIVTLKRPKMPLKSRHPWRQHLARSSTLVSRRRRRSFRSVRKQLGFKPRLTQKMPSFRLRRTKDWPKSRLFKTKQQTRLQTRRLRRTLRLPK